MACRSKQASGWRDGPHTRPACLMASSMAFFAGSPSGASSPLSGRSTPSLITPMECTGVPPMVQPAKAIAVMTRTTTPRTTSARARSLGIDPQDPAVHIGDPERAIAQGERDAGPVDRLDGPVGPRVTGPATPPPTPDPVPLPA